MEWMTRRPLNDKERQVNILFDLSDTRSTTAFLFFSWKPAPIQATWLGYFASTGIEEIDYIVGDHIVLPTDESDRFVEKPYGFVGCYLCFGAHDILTEVSELPAFDE